MATTLRGLVDARAYGDSWAAGPGRYPERIAERLGLASMTNCAISGSRIQNVAAQIVGTRGGLAADPVRGLVTIGALLNNVAAGDAPAARDTARESLRAAIARLSAQTVAPESAFSFTGTFSTLTADDASGGTARWQQPTILAAGSEANNAVVIAVPSGVTYLQLIGLPESTRGATFVVRSGGAEIGRINTHARSVVTSTTSRAPIVWRVPGTAARTITLTMTGQPGYAGPVLGIIDGLLVMSEAPPLIAVLKPLPVPHPSYHHPSALEYLRSLPDLVAEEFGPHVIPVDPLPGWDEATMLGPDLLHPTDAGQEHVADAITAAVTAAMERLTLRAACPGLMP